MSRAVIDPVFDQSKVLPVDQSKVKPVVDHVRARENQPRQVDDLVVSDEAVTDTVERPTIYLTGPVIGFRPVGDVPPLTQLADFAVELHRALGHLCEVTAVTDFGSAPDVFEQRLEAVLAADVVLVCVDDEGCDADAAVEAFVAYYEDVPTILFSTDGTTEPDPKVFAYLEETVVDLSEYEWDAQVRRLVQLVLDALGTDTNTSDDDADDDVEDDEADLD